MKHTTQNGVEIIAVPVKDFKISMVSKPKKSAYTKNYANAGYFGTYSEQGTPFTLPAGHVICDYDANNKWLDYYMNERGKFLNAAKTKVGYNSFTWAYDNPMYQKTISTLIIENGKASIQEIKDISTKYGKADYAIVGIPVIRNGAQVSYSKFVKPQGWFGSELYGTYHVLVGLKANDPYTVYIMGWKSTTGNLVSSGEGYRKFKALGFTDVLKMDGGGSYFIDINGKRKATSENRRINTIFIFEPTSGGTVQPKPEKPEEKPTTPTPPTTGGGSKYPIPTRILRRGYKGDDVKWVQTQLNTAGFKLSVDGSYGPACTYAMKCFQAANRLSPSGVCEATTRNVLVMPKTAVNPYTMPATGSFTKGATGDKVRWAQFQLNKWGASTVDLDGSFGPAMLTALKSFQRSVGLEADGWCGPATREKLKQY